jgi:hypothetical protein
MTRPYLVWLASCSTMHLVEAIGLYHDVDTVVLATDIDIPPIEIENDGCEQARNLFWSAWTMNHITLYDHGLSSVFLSVVSSAEHPPLYALFEF